MPLEWGVGETRVTDFILTHAEAFEVPLTVDLIRLLYEPPKREGEAGSRCTHRIADGQTHACKLVVMFRYKGLYAYCNT